MSKKNIFQILLATICCLLFFSGLNIAATSPGEFLKMNITTDTDGDGIEDTNDICISPSAVPDHLNNHGDYVGESDQILCVGNNLIVYPNYNSLSSLGFHLFPNPTKDILTVDLHNYLEQPISIAIANHLGQRLYYLPERELYDHAIDIDIARLQMPEGIYLLTVRTAEGQQVKQFVIAR